jgi:hypothetical protein
MTWSPATRFDYVTLLPEFVPANRFPGLVKRVMDRFLNPGGRLVVSCYCGTRPAGAPPLVEATLILEEIGPVALGHSEARRPDGSLWTSCAWLDGK